eukprot:4273435-Prymnesium_polylepis.1
MLPPTVPNAAREPTICRQPSPTQKNAAGKRARRSPRALLPATAPDTAYRSTPARGPSRR